MADEFENGEEQVVDWWTVGPFHEIDNPWLDGRRIVNKRGEDEGKCKHGVDLWDECEECEEELE